MLGKRVSISMVGSMAQRVLGGREPRLEDGDHSSIVSEGSTHTGGGASPWVALVALIKHLKHESR